jgi:hypothetical protein
MPGSLLLVTSRVRFPGRNVGIRILSDSSKFSPLSQKMSRLACRHWIKNCTYPLLSLPFVSLGCVNRPRNAIAFSASARFYLSQCRTAQSANPLTCHPEKQQMRQLLRAGPEPSRRIIAIAHLLIAQDVTLVPKFLDDCRRTHLASVGCVRTRLCI